MIELAVDTSIEPAESHWTAAERRTLGGILGFLAGLAALGPVAALGTAAAVALLARLTEPRPRARGRGTDSPLPRCDLQNSRVATAPIAHRRSPIANLR